MPVLRDTFLVLAFSTAAHDVATIADCVVSSNLLAHKMIGVFQILPDELSFPFSVLGGTLVSKVAPFTINA